MKKLDIEEEEIKKKLEEISSSFIVISLTRKRKEKAIRFYHLQK